MQREIHKLILILAFILACPVLVWGDEASICEEAWIDPGYDIKKALQLASQYLEKSHNGVWEIINTYPIHEPEPTEIQAPKNKAKDLESRAEYLEQKDRDIDFIRSVLKRIECIDK